MPPATTYSHRGVRFGDTQSTLKAAVSSVDLDSQLADLGDYGVPGPHGAPNATVIYPGSRSSIQTPHATTLDVNLPLRPYYHPDPASPVLPSQSATQPPLRSLHLQLPAPFEPMTIAPTASYLHVTVHDVWATLWKFWHSPATREELYALPETAREEVRETHRQRNTGASAVDGLRRRDFLRGAVIMGVQPVNDHTIALILGKTPQ